MIHSVRVSGVPFKVTRVEGFAAQTEAAGTCGQETQEILVDAKLGPDVELITIIHEALHGGWALSVLEEIFTDSQEEKVLRALDNMIFSLIRDNPQLVDEVLARG